MNRGRSDNAVDYALDCAFNRVPNRAVAMDSRERFARMAELEEHVAELVESGWTVRQVVYDDEADEPFHATVVLVVDGASEMGGIL